MRKVAKLVEFTLKTRVIVDDRATDDEIVEATYKNIHNKITNGELGENLEGIVDDTECPFGTFETDDPSIDRVILNVEEKQYIVMGKGVPVQVIKFDNFSDWDSVKDINGEYIFDVQIDDDDCDDPYQFQYVNLIWLKDEGRWQTGLDYEGVKVEVTKDPIAQVVLDLLTKK